MTPPLDSTPGPAGHAALRARLQDALRVAMRAREAPAVSALRTALSALDNASAVAQTAAHVPVEGLSADVPRRELTEGEAIAILQAEADERREAMETYMRLGRDPEANRLRAELAALAPFLE